MNPKRLEELRHSYTALFFLCVTYIAIFSLSALTNIWWFASFLEVASVCAALWVGHSSFACKGAPKDYDIGWKPNKLTPLFLLFLPFFVGFIVLLSLGANAVGEKLGYGGAYDFGDNVWLCLLTSALLPAVIEELFCRYVFLPRLTVYSRMGGILASALFFAFLHGNFVQIPYAFLAGFVLGSLAVVCKSIFPCIIFHFVNNAASILLHFYEDTLLPTILLYVLLGSMVVCGIGIFLYRKPILSALSVLRGKNQEEPLKAGPVVGKMFTSPLLIFLILFLVEACLRF